MTAEGVPVAVAGVLLALALASIVPAAAQEMPPEIGPTPIRFYSGNLSVTEFMTYWGTAEGGYSGASREQNEILRRCSVQSMCDYHAWCLIEKERGVWDWSFYRKNYEILKADGIGYNVFCWLHFPPKWFDDDHRYIRYTDLATGDTIPQLSLWAPFTLELYDRFYSRLASEMGDELDFLRLAMPSEYGEIGFCAGMTKWLRPQPNARPAYWCGDKYAMADFRRAMLGKYGSVRKVNEAWQTSFAAEHDIKMPDLKNLSDVMAEQEQWWLDFADWYNESWTDFMAKSVAVVRKHLPKLEIIISLGYGAEALHFGNDEGRHVAEMARLGVSAQTPGDIGYFATRRVSSACRAYGVPYYTEPPGDVPRDRQISRIWMDISNGTQTWFDYPPNLDRARDLLARHKVLMTGEPPVCDLAIWLPTLHHWLHTGEAWPKDTQALADELRDRCDYEVVDDRMIRDGALERLKIRLLAVTGAALLDAEAEKKVEAWARGGGVAVVFGMEDARTPGNQRSRLMELLKGVSAGQPAASGWDYKKIWEQCSVKIGGGTIVWIRAENTQLPLMAELLGYFNSHLSSYGSYSDAPLVDGEADGVLTTLFRDKILLFNTTEKPVTRRLSLRSEDFGGRVGRPESLQMDLALEPREVRAVPLLQKGSSE